MKVLQGHRSADTAFVVDDYPYSFRLRCKIRYWLEVNQKGTRFWSQTTNPKKGGEVWNKPKASIYSVVGVICQVDETDGKPDEVGHIYWTGLSVYDLSKAEDFLTKYRSGLTSEQVSEMERVIRVRKPLEGPY